ncbi:MAG: NUDIX domain-containing protein [Candidatus Aenigmarchaeota archaeon]|nr:NUDIX domain-containing protein [Candidatus Aenigmarchaeota archaeon]
MLSKTLEVSTAFLLHKGKALLLRRSSKVGTYRNKWASVSGYVERFETPLETALKEIYEETGLTLKEIKLLKQSQIEAEDKDLETKWKINTFLFESKTDKIRINWENKEAKWVRPADIGKFDTVPKLKEALDALINSGKEKS